MEWIIAIDGGGTKTIGIAADCSGTIVGRTEQGPANYHIIGINDFKTRIACIVNELAESCNLSKRDLKVVSLGLAGADREQDRKVIVNALGDLDLNCHYIVVSDARAALVAGLGKDEGIVLIAGTGSIAYGINKSGEIIRAGGWGHVASDEGSGYAIGRQGLIRSIKGAEGRDKETTLLPHIMAHFGCQSWDEFIGFINNRGTTKGEIASLAPVIAQTAMAGDSVAAEIVRDAGDELASLVESVISRGFPPGEPVRVCLYGSIVNNIELIRHRLEIALAGKAELVGCQQEAVIGSMLIGLEWLRKRSATNES